MRLIRRLVIAFGVFVVVGGILTNFRGALITLLGAGIVSLGWVRWHLPFRVVIHRPWFRIGDLLAVVAIFALVMAAAWPVVERTFMVRYHASALVLIQPRREDVASQGVMRSFHATLDAARDYFQSAEALENIKSEPAYIALPEPPTADHLERCLRQRLRIDPIPSTMLAQFTLEVDDPARDSAILNAAASSMLMHAVLNNVGWRATIISLAKPPPRQPSYYRGALGAIVSLCALVLSLAIVTAVKVIRIVRIPDEIPRTARREFMDGLSEILVTKVEPIEPEVPIDVENADPHTVTISAP